MLINTVILFLRDTLPIFLLLAFLLTIPAVRATQIYTAVTTGVVLSVLLYLNIGWISQRFDGAGLELIKMSALILAWGFICILSLPSTWLPDWVGKIATYGFIIGLVVPSLVHFFIYFVSYWPNVDGDYTLFIGAFIGLGICTSAATLLFLALENVPLKPWRIGLLHWFVAGQVAYIAVLLEQVNYLPDQLRLWDTQSFIADDGEYGHLLNALIGYEATPSGAYLVIYLVSLALPFALLRLQASIQRLWFERSL